MKRLTTKDLIEISSALDIAYGQEDTYKSLIDKIDAVIAERQTKAKAK